MLKEKLCVLGFKGIGDKIKISGNKMDCKLDYTCRAQHRYKDYFPAKYYSSSDLFNTLSKNTPGHIKHQNTVSRANSLRRGASHALAAKSAVWQ